MKNKRPILLFVVVLLMSFGMSACAVHVRSGKGIPPGQAKKITGEQSAAPYAPGHVKKATGSKSAAPYAPGHNK